ncbi:hypothetical protein [Delftia tsuruhatensis]|uniref:hypothetical protein n=1 Tax=Delftia tsuruhatensis TaxID=180282 RepID=UPI0020287674|nr:hypothetical protein [Delftia tsuruhatensis]
MSRPLLRRPTVSQLTQSDLALCEDLDLECLFEAHPSRPTQPVVDLSGANRRIKALPEGGHGDPMLLKVGFELH